ncbi:MAG: energy transducer TonB [Vicinamibacterales bacterium]
MKAAAFSAFVLLCGAGSVAAQAPSQEAVRPGPGVTLPAVLSEVKPNYTPDAMRQGVTGSVLLECVVNTDGAVGDVRIIKPLHPELDEQATSALRKWRFRPGAKSGTPVPVRIEVEMSFALGRRGLALGSREVHMPGAQGVTLPRIVHEVKPSYTTAAREAGIQGIVGLDVVVLPSGAVGDVRVSTPLEPSLDEEAIKAVKQWRFDPGKKDGKPVPVQVSVECTFTLK